MRCLKSLVAGSVTLMLCLFTAFPALAAAKEAANIVIVADTRGLDGVMFFWASLYNESHLQFALLTVILIPLIGLIFGFLADVVMNCIGIDLRKRQVSEH